jgi:hypothetical protein
MGQKIGPLADRAKQVQRHHIAGGNQARQQSLCLFNRSRWGRGVTAAQASLDKRRRRSRQLRVPGQKEAQGMLAAPLLRVIEGKKGAFVLAPVRRPCCLELFCYQEGPFSRGSVQVSEWETTTVAKLSMKTEIKSCEMPAGCLSKHTAVRSDARAGSW